MQKSLLFALCLAFGVAGCVFAADQTKSKPEDVLQEGVDYFESAAGTKKIEKKNPKELSFEVDNDFGLGEVEVAPAIDYGRLVTAGSKYAEQLAKNGKHKEAVRMLRACREVDARRNASKKTLRDYDFRIASSLASSGDRDEAVKLIEALLSSGADRLPCIKAIFDARRAGRDTVPGYDWLEDVIRTGKYGLTKAEQLELWSYFGFRAFYSMRRPLMERAIAGADSLGKQLQGHGGMCYGAIRKLDELKTFPRNESEIRFPESLADFGFDPDVKIVHAKDFGDLGWDKDDATQCLKEALSSDASTVIVDNMGTPWRITGISLTASECSNKQIIFKKGVRIYAKDDKASWQNTLFNLKGCSNTVWIAEEDVQIGHAPDLASRKRLTHVEGGSGFVVSGCHHFAMSNIRVAYCCCDALSYGGDTVDAYVEDCDFDGCYRQGASFGASCDIYFKNTRFHNIGPGLPGSGVDFEPSYEVYPNNNYYFFDCEFADNAGDGMTFATSTYLPVTVYCKRCTFKSTATALCIKARPGIYWENDMPAPSKLLFEDCAFFGNSEVDPIRFQSTSLFNVTFRRCTLKDRGPFYKNRAPNAPAFLYRLDRDVWKGECKLDGLVTFEDFKVEGYTNAPLFAIRRNPGVTYYPTRFAGEIDHNGRIVKVNGMRIGEMR